MTLVWDFVHIPHTLLHGVEMCCVGAIPAGASAWSPGPSPTRPLPSAPIQGAPTRIPVLSPLVWHSGGQRGSGGCALLRLCLTGLSFILPKAGIKPVVAALGQCVGYLSQENP